MRTFWFLLLALGCGWLDAACADEPPAEKTRYEGKATSHWVVELKKDDVGARRKAVYALLQLGLAAKGAAPLLAKSFEDEDEYVRDTAYAALIALKADALPAVKALRSALNDGRERVRQLALWALLRVDPATAFRDEDFDVRKAAILVVIDPGDFLNEAVFGEVMARLGDEDEEIRGLAANAVGNAYCFHGQDRPYLIAQQSGLVKILCGMATGDEEALPRQWAVYALQWLARYPKGADCTERILPTLIAAARDDEADVRWQALISLGGAGGKSAAAEAAFLAGLKDKQAKVRAAASGLILSVSEGGADAVAALIPLLDDEDHWTRRHAARALGGISEASATVVPALIERLRVEPLRGVFLAVVQALGDIGPAARPALPLIEKVFAASEDPSAKLAYALLRLGTSRREAALERLVDVALSDVGGQAQFLLGKLGSAAALAVPLLIEALLKGEGPVQFEAASTLLAMGSVAKPAIPALEALTKKGAGVDEKLANAARDALEKIRGS